MSREKQRLKQIRLSYLEMKYLKDEAKEKNIALSEHLGTIISKFISNYKKKNYLLLSQSTNEGRKSIWVYEDICDKKVIPFSKEMGVSESCVIYSAIKKHINPK